VTTQDAQARKAGEQRIGGAVGRTVVCDDHFRPFGQHAQPLHGVQHFLAAVTGQNDNGDT
jgi:hypothetical protein